MFAAGDLSASETVWLTFGAATFGSACAVAFQSFVTRRGTRRHFEALLASVGSEMEEISELAEERANRPDGDLRLDPPYPTSAWNQLVGLPESRRLGAEFEALSAFYRAVEDANHKIMQVGSLVHIASVSPVDEVRDSFRSLAQHFSTDAQRTVLDRHARAEQAVRRLQGRMG